MNSCFHKFQCFKSSGDLLKAFKIKPNNITGQLTHTDVTQLSPAILNVKFNQGCTKSGGRVTWKSIKKDIRFLFKRCVLISICNLRCSYWFIYCYIYQLLSSLRCYYLAISK